MKLEAIVLMLVLGTYAENTESKYEKNYMEEAYTFLDKCGSAETLLCFKVRPLSCLLPSVIVCEPGPI